jgi:hypothetical protein
LAWSLRLVARVGADGIVVDAVTVGISVIVVGVGVAAAEVGAGEEPDES